MVDFSKKLEEVIQARGVTQLWLAEQVQSSPATISRYMQGSFYPSVTVLMRMAKALNVSVDYLLNLSVSPIPDEKPEEDITLLCSAYKRADAEHKKILWTVLDSFLTPEEKSFVQNMNKPESNESEETA